MNAASSLRKHGSGLLQRTIQTFASQFGTLLIGVLSAVVLSRGLTPDDRGIYLSITMWNGFLVGFIDVGIYVAAVYLWGKCKENDRKDLFATLFAWACATGIACVGAAFVMSGFIIKGNLHGTELLFAYLFFASILNGPICSMLSGVLAAEERFKWINLVRIGVPVLLTSVWIVYFAFGTLSIAMCLLTSTLIQSLGLIPFVWQTRGYFRSMGRIRIPLFRTGFLYGLRGYGGSVIHVIGGSGTQIMLVALSPSALAFFQTAMSATGVLWAIPHAIGVTSFPALVKEAADKIHERVGRFFRMSALSIVIAGIGLGCAVPFLIPLFFGQAYVPAVIPALITIPNALFGGLSQLLGNALNSTGRTLHGTAATGAYVGVTLLSMIATIPAWGMNGAAFSTLLGFMASFAVRFVWYNVCVHRFSAAECVPGLSDLKELFRIGRGIWRSVDYKLRGKVSA